MSLEIQSCSVLRLHGVWVRCYSLARNRAWIEPGSRLQLSLSAKAGGRGSRDTDRDILGCALMQQMGPLTEQERETKEKCDRGS